MSRLIEAAVEAGEGDVHPKIMLYGRPGTCKTITGLGLAFMAKLKLLNIDGDQSSQVYQTEECWAGVFRRIECSDPVQCTSLLDDLLNDPADYGMVLIDSVSTMSRHAKYGVEAAKRKKKGHLSVYESAFDLSGWDPTKRISFFLFDNVKRLRMPCVVTAREAGRWEKGKEVGIKPETDTQADHEFDVVLRLSRPVPGGDLIVTVDKDRLRGISTERGSVFGLPGAEPFALAQLLWQHYGKLFALPIGANPRASNDQVIRLHSIQGELLGCGMTLPTIHDWLRENYGLSQYESFTPEQADSALVALQSQFAQLTKPQ